MQMQNKLSHAIEAGKVFVDQLEERDKLGIVEFDHSIVVRQEITPARDKERLKRVLASIQLGGSTNISDALIRAQQMLAGPAAEGTKRILLMSDGQANEGIQGAEGIGNVAGQQRDAGVTVSSIGVGLDYDEATMQRIAQLGGGNFYHVREALELVGILQAELNLAKELMTRRTKVKFLRPASVLSVKVHGYATKIENAENSGNPEVAAAFQDQTTIQMSDFSSGEIRQILIELQVDPASAQAAAEPDAAKNLALGVLQIRFGRTEESPLEELEIPISIQVDDDETRRDATNNAAAESIEKVTAEVMSAEANAAHDRAMQELERGNFISTRQILQQQQAQVNQYQQLMPASMRSTPQFQAIQQQQERYNTTIRQMDDAENDINLRRDMRLSSIRTTQQISQGAFSSSNRSQLNANRINTTYSANSLINTQPQQQQQQPNPFSNRWGTSPQFQQNHNQFNPGQQFGQPIMPQFGQPIMPQFGQPIMPQFGQQNPQQQINMNQQTPNRALQWSQPGTFIGFNQQNQPNFGIGRQPLPNVDLNGQIDIQNMNQTNQIQSWSNPNQQQNQDASERLNPLFSNRTSNANANIYNNKFDLQTFIGPPQTTNHLLMNQTKQIQYWTIPSQSLNQQPIHPSQIPIDSQQQPIDPSQIPIDSQQQPIDPSQQSNDPSQQQQIPIIPQDQITSEVSQLQSSEQIQQHQQPLEEEEQQQYSNSEEQQQTQNQHEQQQSEEEQQ